MNRESPDKYIIRAPRTLVAGAPGATVAEAMTNFFLNSFVERGSRVLGHFKKKHTSEDSLKPEIEACNNAYIFLKKEYNS